MTKHRLALFGIISMSFVIGISAIQAEAAKPTTETLDCMDFEGEPLCHTHYDFVCGVENVSGLEAITIEKTIWNDKKFKISEIRKGELFDSNNELIGTIDDKNTQQGFFDGNGASVIKFSHKVDCQNGSTDVFDRIMQVTNHGKKP